MNIPACVAAVAAVSTRKDRKREVEKILAGAADVGTKEKPNRSGIDLLHQRALFMTELQKKNLWPL